MQLINIVFRERPGYRDMALRPFKADATPELIRRIAEDTNDGRDLTPAALSHTAGQIIRPSSEVGGRAIIANGWGQKRFMFIMTVLVRDSRTQRSTLEISGFTDHSDHANSLRGVKFDPEMRLYFNSVTELNQAFMHTPTGDGWRINIGGSNHIIGPQTQPDFSRERLSPGTMTMRPEDVFHSNPQDVLRNSFNRRVAEDSSFVDMRNTVTSKRPRLSDRLNDSSTRYLHRSLRALSTANEGLEYGQSSFQRDSGDVLSDARKQVREKTLSQIPLFADLARDTRILDSGFISYGELVDMNPDFNWDDMKVFFLGNDYRDYSHDSSDWDGGDNTSIAATQIARALPTYMTLHHIAYIDFEANNTGFSGEPIILISEVLPILGKRVTNQALDAFEQRLITELFIDMLPYDGCIFDIRVKASLTADVIIDIQVADETPGEFAFPVFSDSLVAPVIVDRADDITDMGTTILDIVEGLGRTDLVENDDIDSTERFTGSDFSF